MGMCLCCLPLLLWREVSYVSSYRIPFLSNYSFLSQGSHSAWRWSTSIWIAFHFTFSRLRSWADGRRVMGQGRERAFVRWGFLEQCLGFLVWQAGISEALCAWNPHTFWRIPSRSCFFPWRLPRNHCEMIWNTEPPTMFSGVMGLRLLLICAFLPLSADCQNEP